jgi:hypothetical protein
MNFAFFKKNPKLAATTLFFVCGAAIAVAKVWGPVVIPTTETADAQDSEYPLARLYFNTVIRPTMSLSDKAKAIKNHDLFRVIYSDHIADFEIQDPDFSDPIIYLHDVTSESTKDSYYSSHPVCVSGSISDLYMTVPTGFWTQSWPDGNTTVATWQSTGTMSILIGGPRMKSCTIVN